MEGKSDVSDLGWTAIVVTCTSAKVREALEEECKRLSNGGLLPRHEFLLVVDDPRPESNCDGTDSVNGSVPGVGSGGATINALLVAVERLSAYHNHTTINSELVHCSRILVVHHGRMLVHSPGGTAFLHIDPEQSFVPPNKRITPPTLLQHAIWMATNVGARSKAGVWVISLDAFLPFSSLLQPPETEGLNGALVCTVDASLEHAQHHGVVVSGEGNYINKMQYKMPLRDMKEVFTSQIASVISGIMFLSSSLTERLLGLHMLTPLDRCTYYGTDSGIPPLQVSLYFDLLAPLCFGVKEDEYLQGQCGAMYAKAANYGTSTQQESRMARLQIWKELHGLKAVFHTLEGVAHHYLGSDLPFKTSVWPLLPFSRTESLKENTGVGHLGTSTCVEGIVNVLHGKVNIVDSWIGKDVTLNCRESCVLSGLHLPNTKLSIDLTGELVWQFYAYKGNSIVICYGMSDRVSHQYEEANTTVFNAEFSVFLQKTGINKNDLWPHIERRPDQTLLNAKIFMSSCSAVEQMNILVLMVRAVTDNQCQEEWMSRLQEWKSSTRVSFLEALKNCDLMSLIKTRELIHLETIKELIHATSDEVGGKSLLPLFHYAASREAKFVDEVLHALHGELQTPRASTSRLLANVADLLGCMAAGKGGLRSGPAANPLWKNALVQLKAGNQKQALDLMVNTCRQWIASGYPEDLIRAARHYERASQIVISRQVETAETYVNIPWQLPELRQQVNINEWVEAHSPARFDLAGGWSDTPPVCYEQGGAVLNIAVKVNGQKPIGTKVRFVAKPHIVCTLRDWAGGDLQLVWTELEQLRDYDNPVAQGALVKAVLLYCHTVDISSDESLASQLNNRYGGGIEIEVWSMLAKGSGLGSSSLLAGTIVAALAVLFGHPLPQHSHLIHATLVIEQWLTTGGGWQDQVGGLIGGAKLGISQKGTPLRVSSYKIPLSKDFVATLNSHLLLLYTGKVRLARNLLQTVIRNWYARDQTIIECFSELQLVALNAAKAMLNNDLKHLGSCIDDYWSLKKQVASGCEPARVSKLMVCLREYCYGMSLAGAGGGGYFYALKTNAGPLPDHVDLEGLSCDTAELDEKGIEIWRNGEALPNVAEDEVMLTNEVWSKLYKSVL